MAPFPHHGAGARRFDHRVLRAWRLESQYKPEQVCVLADVSYPYLRAVEDGASPNPSIHLLTRLAAVYGRDIGELFTDDAEPAGAR
jgi:transcriptional regulator with XRE-family HTH domain